MRKRLAFIFHRSGERGIALILTLAIITLVTLILIAFAVSMRVENTASKSFNDLVKARELALGAIDQAVATIREATPVRTETAAGISTYVTTPGAIYHYDGTIATPAPQALYSGPTSADTTNLNAGFWITGGTDGNGEFNNLNNSAMKVGWVYVDEKGNTGTVLPLANPLVGRFAFWVDDEACKINLNAAWTRGVANSGVVPDTYSSANAAYGDTSEVDLTRLLVDPFAFVNDIVNGRTPNPYTTIEEVKRANLGIVASVFDDNRFSLTAYSDDANYSAYTDNLDVFGRQRLPLFPLNNPGDIDGTGGPNSAYTRLSDPDGALAKVCSPPPGNGTFLTKYPVVSSVDGLKQVIANMIAYQIDPASAAPPDGNPGADPPPYLGLARTPYVDRVEIRYTDNGDDSHVTRTITVELFYPYSADAQYTSGIVGSEDKLIVKNLPAVGIASMFTVPFTTGPITITIPGSTPFNNATPQVFTYQDVATLVPPTPPSPFPPLPIPIVAGTITVDYNRGGGNYRLDCAQVPVQTVTLTIPWSPAVGSPVWHGAVVSDPCVNENTANWTSYNNPTAGSFTYPNGNDVSKAHIRSAPMQSIGELGYIHRPEPWKHVTLQPEPAAEKAANQIPDWAMLDIFTVANAKTVGRININGFVSPSFPVAASRRVVPLKALLSNLIASPGPVANNIYDGAYGDTFGNTKAYDTIGEVCEVPGLADDPLKSEADREATVRRIANLITVRSNTFTIWVLAQSIKDVDKNGNYNPPINPPPGSPLGNDFISGDVIAQSVVERYEKPPGNPPKFRVRYFRYLYN